MNNKIVHVRLLNINIYKNGMYPNNCILDINIYYNLRLGKVDL